MYIFVYIYIHTYIYSSPRIRPRALIRLEDPTVSSRTYVGLF